MNNWNQILKYDSAELQSVEFIIKGIHRFFLNAVDNLCIASSAINYMTKDRWKFLSSILSTLSSHYDINYGVYENPFGLLFDASAQSIESKDFPALHDGIFPETEAGELKRLKGERDQIESNAFCLQERHIEICRRIKELSRLEPAHSLSVLVLEG